MNKSLLCSRILNVSGDWFYYFVIVIFIYNLNPSPIILGLLSLSYTLPGFVLSAMLAKLIKYKNQKLVSIYSNIGRMLAIFLMFLTNNPLIVVLLVFVEQIFSITEIIAYKDITTHVIYGDDSLEEYNRIENILSSISRIMIIPLYLGTINIVGVKFFLLIDVLLTMASIILMTFIRGNFSNTPMLGSNQKKEGFVKSLALRKVKKRFPAEIAILLFSVTSLSLGISLSDSYGILFIGEASNSINIGYGMLVFIGTISELLSSYFFRKKTILKSKIALHVSAAFSLLLLSSIVKNSVLFIISICVIRFFFCEYDLALRLNLQTNHSNEINYYSSIQITLRDGLSFFNSVLGAIIIKQINISNYFVIISIGVILALIFIQCRYE